MHGEPEHLLAGSLGVLYLVVHGAVVLMTEATWVAELGVVLAAVAGFSQLFSP